MLQHLGGGHGWFIGRRVFEFWGWRDEFFTNTRNQGARTVINFNVKNRYLLIVISLSLFGCKKPGNLERILTTQGRYWTVSIIEKNEKYTYENGQINFLSNGDYRYYLSDNPSIKGKDGQMISSSWKYNEKDNLLEIGMDWKFKVLRYTSDSIFLQKSEPKSAKFLFVKKVDKGHN